MRPRTVGRIIEPGAVYNNRDEIVGFRCYECNRIFPSLFGDTCNSCRAIERRHKEILVAIKKEEV